MVFIKQVSKEVWEKDFEEITHKVVFDEDLPDDIQDYDFVLVSEDDEKEIVGYVTVQELTKDMCFIVYGGSFPKYRATKKAYISFSGYVDFLHSMYKTVGFVTAHDNFPMIKFGAKKEFKICDMYKKDNKILLEHYKTRSE